MSDSLRPCGLWPARLLCLWNAPGKNTGVGCHALLQGIFPTQGSNLALLLCRQILYHLSYQGSPLSPNEAPCVLSSGATSISMDTCTTKRQVFHSPHTQNILGRQDNHSRHSHSREGDVGKHISDIVTVT